MKIIKNTKDIVNIDNVVLLKFGAVWCAPCKQMQPILEKLEKDVNSIDMYSVDIDSGSELVNKFNISSVPTIIILNGGVEVKRIVGFQPYQKLKQFIME